MLGPTQRVPLRGASSPASTRSEHGLAGAVGPDHADPLAARDRRARRRAAPGRSPNAKSALVERDHALAAARGAAQLERHLAPLEHRPVDLLHLVDLHLLHASPAWRARLLLGDVRPVAEAPDRLLEARDLLALRHALLLLALELELARDRVGASRRRARCGPSPRSSSAIVPTHSSSRWRSWETISTAPSKSSIRSLERVAARHVEVRLGLVEQQHVRAGARGRRRARRACAGRRSARGWAGRARRRRAPSALRACRASLSARSPPSSDHWPSSRSWLASARSIARCRPRAPGRRAAARPARARARARPAPAARRGRWRAAHARRPRRSAAATRARARGGG